MKKINNILKNTETNQLKEVIKGLFNSENMDADIPLQAALNELETRIPENDFIAFCNQF